MRKCCVAIANAPIYSANEPRGGRALLSDRRRRRLGGRDRRADAAASAPCRRSPALALVVVQHLDPHYESQLSTILQAQSSLPVVEAEHGVKVQPDHVYVIQPNTNVALADGVLSVTPRPDDRRPHYPVDHFLRSLAAVQGRRSVGVILSGTGSDGTLGLSEIKAAGGITFAQDEHTAQHGGMPQSADCQRRGRSGAAARRDRRATGGAAGASLSEAVRRSRAAQADDGSEDFHRVIAALRADERRRLQPVSRHDDQTADGPAHAAARFQVARASTRSYLERDPPKPRRSTVTSSSTSRASFATRRCSRN